MCLVICGLAGKLEKIVPRAIETDLFNIIEEEEKAESPTLTWTSWACWE